jgi:hypothetical protein
MVVNFRIRGISRRGACKLARTPMLKKKKYISNLTVDISSTVKTIFDSF